MCGFKVSFHCLVRGGRECSHILALWASATLKGSVNLEQGIKISNFIMGKGQQFHRNHKLVSRNRVRIWRPQWHPQQIVPSPHAIPHPLGSSNFRYIHFQLIFFLYLLLSNRQRNTINWGGVSESISLKPPRSLPSLLKPKIL